MHIFVLAGATSENDMFHGGIQMLFSWDDFLTAVLQLQGKPFEKLIGFALVCTGWTDVTLTSVNRDYGADLYARPFDNIPTVVECKRWVNAVPANVITKLHAARKIYKAQRAILVTSYHVGRSGHIQAKELGVKIWELPEVRNLLRETLRSLCDQHQLQVWRFVLAHRLIPAWAERPNDVEYLPEDWAIIDRTVSNTYPPGGSYPALEWMCDDWIPRDPELLTTKTLTKIQLSCKFR